MKPSCPLKLCQKHISNDSPQDKENRYFYNPFSTITNIQSSLKDNTEQIRLLKQLIKKGSEKSTKKKQHCNKTEQMKENVPYMECSQSTQYLCPNNIVPYVYCIPYVPNYISCAMPYMIDPTSPTQANSNNYQSFSCQTNKVCSLLDKNIDIDTFIKESKHIRKTSNLRLGSNFSNSKKATHLDEISPEPHLIKTASQFKMPLSNAATVDNYIPQKSNTKENEVMAFSIDRPLHPPPERLKSYTSAKKKPNRMEKEKDQLSEYKKKVLRNKRMQQNSPSTSDVDKSATILMNGEKRKISQKEMVADTKKRYEQLPEIMEKAKAKSKQMLKHEVEKKKEAIKKFDLVY